MAEPLMLYVTLSITRASIYQIYLSAKSGLERLGIFETAKYVLSILTFAALLFYPSFPQRIKPDSYEDVLAEKDIDITAAYNAVEEVVNEYEMLLEKSDRDRKYAEEICKERQSLNAQKTFLKNKLGNFESFSDLERKFKELEWQLEGERQHRRDEDKERRRLVGIAQLANSEVFLAKSSTAALNLEWQVAKIDYLERLKVLDRQRHDAVNGEAASRKELKAMRRVTGNDQTADQKFPLGNEEIDRLRAKLMTKTTSCDAQLAAKDKKIHDLAISLRSARLDYAELEKSLGLEGLSDEEVEGAEGADEIEGTEGVEGADEIEVTERVEGEKEAQRPEEGEFDDKEEGKDNDKEEEEEYGEWEDEEEDEEEEEEEEEEEDDDEEEDGGLHEVENEKSSKEVD